MILKAGDVFCTKYSMIISSLINKWQCFLSTDNKSLYSHTGIILDKNGTTFESIFTNKKYNLYERYKESQILIVRYPSITETQWKKVIAEFLPMYEGRWYPYHRILLNLFPPLAKRIHFNKKNLVCSELVAEFLHKGYEMFGVEENGIKWPRHGFSHGTIPDRLCDEWHRWKKYKIIYEGIL